MKIDNSWIQQSFFLYKFFSSHYQSILFFHLHRCSEANGRNANKVTLYEDAAKKQLKEFISALRGCESMVHACSSLGVILGNTDSKLLHHLLTPGTIQIELFTHAANSGGI